MPFFSAAWPLRASFCLLLVLTALGPEPACAQLFSSGADRPQPSQSLAPTLALIDFTYRGSEQLDATFDYVAPAYGLTYARPNLTITAVTGRSDPSPDAPAQRELQLLDVSLFTWGEVFSLLGDEAGGRRLFVPIALHSGYRRVSGEETVSGFTDVFGVTVVGLGSGLSFSSGLGRRLYVEARALPAIGLATRSIGNANGWSRLFDGDLALYAGPFAGRFGLSAGYGFRLQYWDVGVSDFLALGGDVFDYRGLQHTFRLGISW